MFIPEAGHLVFVIILGHVLGGEDCQELKQLTATDTIQHISSPNFPGVYPRPSSCKWVVQSNLEDGMVNFRMVNFSLDTSTHCYADSLEIKDGSYRLGPKIIKWCGRKTTNRIYRTTKREAYVAFQAISHGNDATGFYIEFWTTVKDPVQEGKPVFTIVHYILAGVTGFLLLSVIIAVTMITCIRGYKDFQRKHQIMIFFE